MNATLYTMTVAEIEAARLRGCPHAVLARHATRHDVSGLADADLLQFIHNLCAADPTTVAVVGPPDADRAIRRAIGLTMHRQSGGYIAHKGQLGPQRVILRASYR